MKTKILKYIILGISAVTLLGILLGTYYFTSATLSFFNDDELSLIFTKSSGSSFDRDRLLEKTEKRSFGFSDIEFHFRKKVFGKGRGDTTITLKYITLQNSRDQVEIEKEGLPLENFTGSNTIKTTYYNIESLHSIPIENMNRDFWKPFLLSRVITKFIFYICIIALIISITINTFKATPFTYKIRNKLYFLAGIIFLFVLTSWIFNNVLSQHLLEYYQITNGPNFFYNTWFLMAILTLFIAAIFDYGIRLQKEQDLTI